MRKDGARKGPKPSGRNVREDERHSTRLVVRCSSELAERARATCLARGLTLADLVHAGIETVLVR